MYDEVWKWCQWLEPTQDHNHDYKDHPKGKMPVCKKLFHGPVTGQVGEGRDQMFVWDCQKGDQEPTCAQCINIDSVPRNNEQWFKQYSTQTESQEAYRSRAEWHSRCGSYLRFESEDGSGSKEYSEGRGHIRLGGAISEDEKKGHLNHCPDGSMDMHSVHEEVAITAEHKGTRVAVFSPENESDIAASMDDFESNAYVRIMKSGEIILHSPIKITLEAPLIDEITDLVHNHGNQQIDGFCSHDGCSCPCGGSGGSTCEGGWFE